MSFSIVLSIGNLWWWWRETIAKAWRAHLAPEKYRPFKNCSFHAGLAFWSQSCQMSFQFLGPRIINCGTTQIEGILAFKSSPHSICSKARQSSNLELYVMHTSYLVIVAWDIPLPKPDYPAGPQEAHWSPLFPHSPWRYLSFQYLAFSAFPLWKLLSWFRDGGLWVSPSSS